MIIVVLGTRAQLIKMAPVMLELDIRQAPYLLVYTGQHQKTMSELRIDLGTRQPDIVLWDGPEIDTIFSFPKFYFRTRRAWKKLVSPTIRQHEKNVVVVHGDTVSTLIGAQNGRADGAIIAHVEAGLRSGNMLNPFPEEIIRRLASRWARIHFCPTDWAAENLRRSRTPGQIISTTVNTLQDTLRLAMAKPTSNDLDVPTRPYWLVSLHRFETITSRRRLSEMVRTLIAAADSSLLLFILHPATKIALAKFHLLEKLEQQKNIDLRSRMSYTSFIKLLVHSRGLMTDGGSNQEECSYLGHPCLVLRQVTERMEGVGENIMVSQFNHQVLLNWLNNPEQYRRSAHFSATSPSKIIVDFLQHPAPLQEQ